MKPWAQKFYNSKVWHDCHNQIHFEKYSATREDVIFDERGNLVKRGETELCSWGFIFFCTTKEIGFLHNMVRLK